MALFFDAAWMDARLAERGLNRAMLAAAAGMDEQELALAFKDQREIAPREVQAFAALLGIDEQEAASRCGVTTRLAPARAVGLEARLAALEAQLARIEAKLDAVLRSARDHA